MIVGTRQGIGELTIEGNISEDIKACIFKVLDFGKLSEVVGRDSHIEDEDRCEYSKQDHYQVAILK